MRGGRQPRNVNNAAQLRSQLLTHKTNADKRLHRDLKELKNQEVPLVGVTACPRDDTIYQWCGNLRAPADSVYAGGVFHFEMLFPQNYPVQPPSVNLLGFNLDHPNVFGSKLCLDMLEPKKAGRWYEGWNSAYTVESIMIQLQSFLFEKPKVKKGDDKEELMDKYKEIVNQANSYKCPKCKHRGSIECYPAFNDKEADVNAFVIPRSPEEMVAQELLCYHTRTNLQEGSLGIGVSVSRLPRTGEIRSVTPSLDLLCMRAFTKQSVRTSIDGEKFTHWLPLYFGEKAPYDKKTQIFNE
jgi:ubiquitin-protein ligase